MTKWGATDHFGLISSLKDSVISTFFSYGELGCKNNLAPIGYTKLEAGLKRLSASGVSTYLIPGGQHTHTGGKGSFHTQKVNDIALYKWITELQAGSNPGSVIPK